MTGSFQPRQLTLARERRGLTKAQLAELCGVDRKTVTEWESGRVAVPPVGTMARQLGFSERFFFEEAGRRLLPEEANFRALTNMSARRTHQTLATASLVARLSRWLDDHFQTPDLDLPRWQEGEAQASTDTPPAQPAAAMVRSAWKLGNQVIPDLTALLESKGVRIFALPAEIREVDAFAVWLDDRPTIFLNLDKSAERLRFDLAHELGHLVMHREAVTVKKKKFEAEANSFAGHFLVPPGAVYSKVRLQPTLDEVFLLKKHFRVSAVSMLFRLHECGLVNDWQYRTWMVELSKLGYRSSEPDGLEREHSQLLTGALRLAREDGYTLKTIAAELNVPAEDIAGAFAGLAPMPIG